MLTNQQLSLCSIALVIPQVLSAPATLSPSQNFTIVAPEGTTNHGNPNLLCTRSTWSDIATFFLANYIAHAATVKLDPGQPVLRGFWSMLMVLILPTFGAYKGLDAIRRCAIFGGPPLQKAKKAGALCEVVRTRGWKAQPGLGGLVQGVQLKSTRDERNLAKIKIILESRKRWVATKLSWLTRREAQLHRILPMVTKMVTRSEEDVIEFLNVLLPGVRTLLQDEGILVRWWFYASIYFNTRLSRRPDSLELLDLSEGLKQAIPPRFIPHKIRIEGLSGRERFKASRKMLDLNGRNVHGLCCLPRGYELAIIRSDSTVLELNDGRNSESPTAQSDIPNSNESGSFVNSDLSWSYSFAKGLVAVFQALYACATLYETRGDQIERYGYAAFGLTVAPYLVMSIINLIGTVLTPDYSTVFMVESEIMEEAKQREGACFEGAVGKLMSNKPSTASSFNATFKLDDQNQTFLEIAEGSGNTEVTPPMSTPLGESTDKSRSIILPAGQDAPKDACHMRDLFVSSDLRPLWSMQNFTLLAATVGLVSVGINGVLSHFRPGESTHAQRVWTMTWLAVGIIYGTMVANIEMVITALPINNAWVSTSAWALMTASYCAPAIGGFVVVGQMLINYGHCIRIGEESF